MNTILLTAQIIRKDTKCITPSIDGFRKEHKRVLAIKFSNPIETLVITLYSQLLTSILNARMPQIVSNLLVGAESIALK